MKETLASKEAELEAVREEQKSLAAKIKSQETTISYFRKKTEDL